MKFVVAIVENEDARALVNKLADAGFSPTLISGTESYLHHTRALVVFGASVDRQPQALAIIEKACHRRQNYENPVPPITELGELFPMRPPQKQVGGANVFIFEASQFFNF